jgi:epoxyqueuosine reductase QueG
MDAARAKALALARGASAAGIVVAGDIQEFERFVTAVASVPAGEAYLNRDIQRRKNIKGWCANAQSVLVCAFRYWEPGQDYGAAMKRAGELKEFLRATGRKVKQSPLLEAPGAKISRYALCRDYHLTVKERLQEILADIRKEFPSAEGRAFCDTSAVMEKELARQAGLGFRGKNTLLLSPELGSYFFIGGIALNFALDADAPLEGSCGSCEACIKACPTGALKAGALDANRCLAYWTTQSKEPIPADIAAKASYAYGCDLCQEACPYNKKPGAIAPGFEIIK